MNPVDDFVDEREPLDRDTRPPLPPSPCDDPCPLAASCAARLWACGAFAKYVENGHWPPDAPRKPSSEIYRRIYSSGGPPAPDLEAVPRKATPRKVRLNFRRVPLAEQLAARKAARLAERAS
jgi:hypothetical protein